MFGSVDGGRLSVPVNEQDHLLGNFDAPLLLVEYGDYECSFCLEAYFALNDFLKVVPENTIGYVFRNFPITQVHPHAEEAAEAAEIAADQNKFWPMHRALFEHQVALDPNDLIQYAEELEIEADKFVKQLEAHVKARRVREDFTSGVRSGVNGTPSFFVNESKFPGDVYMLVEALSTALQRGH